ncbi:MarR family winged helix-turn-helix transcriptional regulator [Gordonia polyisoprenivorans]|uniref:MarR family winged helix-turn-helix transcriptional regulator n=1 Tax=Gordonia polyisoprenivorans TaxID=84595 RepID=UPI001AD74689|nr:MarR family winged helix-turn-helix transcriptional regulator [Gordonia polyisoprenivorans]QTI69857.1 winged helix-turn-helix transcriptional regulator [Gordonia polyisoprenivorans]
MNTEESARLSDDELAVWSAFVDGGWALMAEVTAGFSAAGVSVNDMRVLEIIAARETIGISEIAAAMHAGVSTVSRVVARLIEDEILERVHSRSDARHRLVRLTDHGRAQLRAQLDIRDAVVRKHVIEVLTTEEFESLRRIFGKIRDGSSARPCSDGLG